MLGRAAQLGQETTHKYRGLRHRTGTSPKKELRCRKQELVGWRIEAKDITSMLQFKPCLLTPNQQRCVARLLITRTPRRCQWRRRVACSDSCPHCQLLTPESSSFDFGRVAVCPSEDATCCPACLYAQGCVPCERVSAKHKHQRCNVCFSTRMLQELNFIEWANKDASRVRLFFAWVAPWEPSVIAVSTMDASRIGCSRKWMSLRCATVDMSVRNVQNNKTSCGVPQTLTQVCASCWP